MHKTVISVVAAFFLVSICSVAAQSEDLSKLVKKVVEKSTLDQPGTKPFHLKATYAPSRERDKDSHRAGDIEIWWESTTKWRREVRSPDFHQILIVDGGREWQKHEGNYFPEWLRELAVAIIQPVPLPIDVLLERVKTAETRHLMGQTNVSWESSSGPGDAQSNGKGYLALMDQTGLLFYTGGPGWSGQYHDYKEFHGRMAARTVASGGWPEVTAKVSILEDLGAMPNGFFDTNAPGGDTHPIETVVLNEVELRKNLSAEKPIVWPALKDGPLEGMVWTEVVLDRTGKIREMIPPIADNNGVKDTAERGFCAMQFQPVLRDGVPVQVLARLSMPFKTTRPVGEETFNSARTYFESGRKVSFLSAGANASYTLRAEFQTGTKDGVQIGRYEDTWLSATEWRREAWIGSSHLVRTQSGEKHYVLAEGPDAALLRLVMMILEPIPAGDTMTENDWRIRRDICDKVKTIRVMRGPESPNGEMDPGHSQGYWFDETGQLVKSYTASFEIRPLNVEAYGGVQVARQIDVRKDGKLGMRVIVKEIGPAERGHKNGFSLKGHEWQRAFTAEVR